MSEASAVRGSNFPPGPIDTLREQLAADASRLFARRDELLASAARAPAEVCDDETAGKVGDLVKLISTVLKAAETDRTRAKAPHIEAGRVVDAFFQTTLLEPLERVKSIVQGRLGIFLEAKAAAARAAAEADTPAAPLAELSRSRGDLGSVAGLRSTWDWQVSDLAQVPRQFLMLNPDAIRAHIKARPKDAPPAPIAGLKFITRTSTVVR